MTEHRPRYAGTEVPVCAVCQDWWPCPHAEVAVTEPKPTPAAAIEARMPGYLYLDTEGDQVATTDLGDGVLVDYRPDGRIAGIEHVHGPVDADVLLRVLRAARWHASA